jgi:hypothetical protein
VFLLFHFLNFHATLERRPISPPEKPSEFNGVFSLHVAYQQARRFGRQRITRRSVVLVVQLTLILMELWSGRSFCRVFWSLEVASLRPAKYIIKVKEDALAEPHIPRRFFFHYTEGEVGRTKQQTDKTATRMKPADALQISRLVALQLCFGFCSVNSSFGKAPPTPGVRHHFCSFSSGRTGASLKWIE